MKILKQMQKTGLALWMAVSMIFFNCITVQAEVKWPDQPSVQSPCVIVMEASTGTILYEKQADEKNYPASITKIMTALVTLDNCELNEEIEYSYHATHSIEYGSRYRYDSLCQGPSGKKLSCKYYKDHDRTGHLRPLRFK